MKGNMRLVLTGFMGVGKSTVARRLASILKVKRLDLDHFVEAAEQCKLPALIEQKGEAYFRQAETEGLKKILEETDAQVISLGGGTWVFEQNRKMIREHNCTTVWLESTFEHCWKNITRGKTVRALIKDRETVRKLFDERQKFYCLADWHFVVRPELTLYEIAEKIADEIFS